jgi:aminoglycoside phosphotransferase (APT) family kinase protein
MDSVMSGPAAEGKRLHWPELPADVRAAIATVAGAAIVGAQTQPHGFSPGVAARLRLTDGRRVFVKAVSATTNPESPAMHRAEARLTGAFPPGVPVPRLIGVYDDGNWVALVYEDVEGRHPAMPWRTEELEHVMASLVRLHAALTPCPVPDWPRVVDDADTAAEFASWSVADADTLEEWTRVHLDQLIALESEWRDAAGGDTLLHLDLRADNMLIRPDGEVMFVDWPWGACGAPLLDVVGLAPSVRMQGGPDLDWLLARHPAAAAGGRRAADSLLAAVAGMFTSRASWPPPPGLPTLRNFQDAQGRAAREMLAARLGNP